MNAIFPFGFPLPTAFYLTLYVLTLLVHVLFMNYVLAGSAYLAWVSVFTGGERRQRQKSPTALVLRDWMPAALSGAITAGVAPLLFVQILYKQPFYTANLLLFHRWMLILPVLIVGFYLCYLLKSRLVGAWPLAARAVVGIGAFACFAFTAYSWTENHVLAMQGTQEWGEFYTANSMVHFDAAMLPRLAVLFFAAFPTMAMLVGWQLKIIQRRTAATATDSPTELAPTLTAEQETFEARRLAGIAFVGLLAALLCGAWFFAVIDETVRGVLVSQLALPYFVLAMTGLLLQAAAWAATWQSGRLTKGMLVLAGIGCIIGVLGAAVVRESFRLASIDIAAFHAQHEQASRVGGLVAFLVLAVINALLIALCIRLAARGAPQDVSRQIT